MSAKRAQCPKDTLKWTAVQIHAVTWMLGFFGGVLGAYTDKFGCRMLQDICSCKTNYVTQDSRTDYKLIFWVTSTE